LNSLENDEKEDELKTNKIENANKLYKISSIHMNCNERLLRQRVYFYFLILFYGFAFFLLLF